MHGSTFVAGSCVLLKKEANWTGLLQEFVIVWWSSGESSMSSSPVDVCLSGWEGLPGSDAPK